MDKSGSWFLHKWNIGRKWVKIEETQQANLFKYKFDANLFLYALK